MDKKFRCRDDFDMSEGLERQEVDLQHEAKDFPQINELNAVLDESPKKSDVKQRKISNVFDFSIKKC